MDAGAPGLPVSSHFCFRLIFRLFELIGDVLTSKYVVTLVYEPLL